MSEFKDLLRAIGVRGQDIISLGTMYTDTDGERRYHNRAHRASKAVEVVEGWEERDGWFSVGLLSDEGTKHRRVADVIGVRSLYTDLDIKPDGLASMDEVRAVVDRLSAVLGCRPAAGVLTGGGVQPHWRVEKGPTTDWAAGDAGDATRRRTASLYRRWGRLVRMVVEVETNGTGKVDSVWDLARILRVPGTTNTKYAVEGSSAGRKVRLWDEPMGLETVSLERLEEILGDLGIDELAGDGEMAGTVVSPVDEWGWAPAECVYVRAMIEGWKDAEPAGRHPWLMGQATRLAAARRLGYLNEDLWMRGCEVLWERFCELLDRPGDARGVESGDREAFDWGERAAAGMDVERAISELGGRDGDPHRHDGNPDDPFTNVCPAARRGKDAVTEKADPGSDDAPPDIDVASAHREGSADIDPSDKDDRIDSSAWDGGIFTDRWLAESFAWNICRLRFCWASAFGWLEWSGKVWSRCPEERVTEAAGRWGRTKLSERVKAGDIDSAKYKGWKSMVSEKRQRDVVKLARGLTEVDGALFDADPDVINCQNGVVNLRTGEVSGQSPEMLMMKITACDYVPGAVHEDWDRALETMPDAVTDWMQVRYGQAITGYKVSDDKLIVQNGGGSNGKSSVFGGLNALGDYCQQISDRVILADPKDHPTELMDLQGLRIAYIEETPEARRLNVQRLKKLLGTKKITARHIRKDSTVFNVTHALFLSTNYRPMVEETDPGTWRRLALVTFPYTYVRGDDERLHSGDVLDDGEPVYRLEDPDIRRRVEDSPTGQHEAVLAWMVAGAQRWYEAGRAMPAMPERVAADTRAWQAESDVVLAYTQDRIVFDRERHVASGDLLLDFNAWLENHGHKPWSMKLLTTRFENSDEVRRNRVTQRRLRQGQKTGTERLSRPSTDSVWMHLSTLGNQYMAWRGMRFSDDGSEGENDVEKDSQNRSNDINPFTS